VDQREPACVAVLQVLQCFVEHHAAHAAVAVDQGEFRRQGFFQRAGHQREDGCDARAGRETHAVHGTRLVHGEAPIGWHGLERVAGLQRRGRPVGKHATIHRADAQREFAALREQAARAADRIAAPYVLPVDGGAHREELAGLESEGGALLGRDGEGDRHRASGFGADANDREFVEAGGGAHGVSTA
jgi:hypothetical protein